MALGAPSHYTLISSNVLIRCEKILVAATTCSRALYGRAFTRRHKACDYSALVFSHVLRILRKVVIMVALPSAMYGQVLEVKSPSTPEGSPVKVSVPDAQWRPAGTLAFRFRSSRTIRFAQDERPAKMTLVQCPVLSADLSEDKNHTMLAVRAASAEGAGPGGRLDLSHLKGDRWYHLALAWDAEKGRLEAYLNGVLQEPLRLGGPAEPWKPVEKPSGPLVLGGTLGEGDQAARIAVDSIQLYSTFLDEAAVAATLAPYRRGTGRAGWDIPPLEGEGRTVFKEPLDLSPYKLDTVYEADFSQPLSVVAEDALFDGSPRTNSLVRGEKRARLPQGKDWVLEGPGRAWTEGGRLHVENHKTETGGPSTALSLSKGGHVVLWNTRVFPEDFLLEFDMSPKDSSKGLGIVFFCAKSREPRTNMLVRGEGGGIFDLNLPRRAGDFKNYHSGALNCYHVSYWACDANGLHRRTANLRKNFGFYLSACGNDNIAGKGPGPHRVRLLKVGGKIRIETCGVLSLAYDDDGKTYGPVWGEGCIGLRQMVYTESASYGYFKVSRVEARK